MRQQVRARKPSWIADETGVWWTCACDGDVVARVDSRTNRITTNLAERFPVGIEVAFGSVWVVNEGSGNIDQIDPHSGRLVARLHIIGLPEVLGIGFGSVWVNDDYGRVLRIKPHSADGRPALRRRDGRGVRMLSTKSSRRENQSRRDDQPSQFFGVICVGVSSRFSPANRHDLALWAEF